MGYDFGDSIRALTTRRGSSRAGEIAFDAVYRRAFGAVVRAVGEDAAQDAALIIDLLEREVDAVERARPVLRECAGERHQCANLGALGHGGQHEGRAALLFEKDNGRVDRVTKIVLDGHPRRRRPADLLRTRAAAHARFEEIHVHRRQSHRHCRAPRQRLPDCPRRQHVQIGKHR